MQPAALAWQNPHTPVSTQFGDVYFSKTDGIAETEYVFLKHNQLPERFKTPGEFTIGENGFGTGLNFLVTAAQWQKHAHPGAQLHFVSVEKYPIPKQALQEFYEQFPQWRIFTQTLLSQYPDLTEGAHKLYFSNQRIQLTLLLGDALEQWQQHTDKIDAWYLDGFAPARNPDIWSLELFAELARLSHAKTTFATFTAASSVRKNLENAGFSVQKDKGFKYKREMLFGRLGLFSF